MTLKTLKDIEIGGEYAEINDIDVASKKDLKQEAIKWVKEIENTKKDQKTKGELIMWIGHFFGITEEHLK